MMNGRSVYSSLIVLQPKEQREYARHLRYIHNNGFNTSVIQKSCLQSSYGRAVVTIARTDNSDHRYVIEMVNVLDAIKAASFLVGRIVAKERTTQSRVRVEWPRVSVTA